MRNPFCVSFLIFHVLALGPTNSSVGRASDCSSEGRQFEPGLVDIETLLTQLVECQPHELKDVGSIPIRGTSCLTQFSYDSICLYGRTNCCGHQFICVTND